MSGRKQTASTARLAVLIALALLSSTSPLVAHAQKIAIVGARVHTIAGKPIENGTVLIENGRVVSVQADGSVPAGAERIDARGKIVTPGLVAAATQLGTVEVDSLDDTTDHSVAAGPLGAAFDVQFAINTNSTSVAQARADGLTRAVTAPTGSAGAPYSGAAALLRLRAGPQLLERTRVAMFATIGGMASQAGGSRAAQWMILRNSLQEARAYRRSRAPRDQLLNHLDAEALRDVVEGRMPLALRVERESDVREAMRLSDEMKVRVILFGASEAWRVAPELAQRGIPVVLDATINLPATFDQLGARADSAALLHRAGVSIGFAVPGLHLTHNAATSLREAAGLAVANGLPWDAALQAITLNPATMFGIAERTGTLAAGQDADLVIWSGDPLEPSSSVEAVFIDGKRAPTRTRQDALAERYHPRRMSEPLPPAYRR